VTTESQHPLKVFLCHASGDKPQVRVLYKRLVAEGVDAWLDQEKLLPGQDWRVEIPRAVKEADVVVICLSNKSITKEGYVQKEIKFALDIAEEKLEGSIFLIPARLEDCPVPDQMSRWQWVDLFEENGFIRLLRSLKLRADKVGAVIQPSPQAEDDQESERRINQLYTEGLAAFYTEDWDKACRRFQSILSERPNHKNANEKLEEAERQRDLAKLYAQVTEAYRSEKWEDAVRSLEEVTRKSGDYKDVSQLLRNAKKQRQLRDLYAEAKALHAAQKWQAVLKVFDQISGIDPTYQDPQALLPSAQREMAELRRLNELNDLYSNAVHEMDASHWYEARKLLEQVHKSQRGFLETELLLRKVENEITKLEDQRKRTAQVQMLYEQARKMASASQWGKALAHMEEIHKLDSQFVDSGSIEEKSKAGLAREEQAAQQRKDLAALYAEAVSLLDAKKYQEALEKWNAIQAADPTYKDTSRVRVTARKKLDELSRPEKTEKPRLNKWVDWFKVEENHPSDQQILIEKWLFVSFVSIAVVRFLWEIIGNRTNLWGNTSGLVAYQLLLFGFYGTVVAVVYKNSFSNWSKQSSWILIVGWALCPLVALMDGKLISDLSLAWMIAKIFTALCLSVAMIWAKVSVKQIIVIFIAWALSWSAGHLLGNYLISTFTRYTWAFADAFSILLGLFITLGLQTENAAKILWMAFWGALGFAAGNYINGLSFWSDSLPAEFFYAIWGLVGGAVLEAPSREWRRVLLVSVACGLGMLVSGYIGLRILPLITGESYFAATYPEMALVLQQILNGTCLGLAIGLLIRRGAAIGLLVVLGMGVFILTRSLHLEVFHFEGIWWGALRGAWIGLVLGFGYGYMGRAKQVPGKAEVTE
jgi:outer membrane protein assembly factor BamD (BamD/ComL family)